MKRKHQEVQENIAKRRKIDDNEKMDDYCQKFSEFFMWTPPYIAVHMECAVGSKWKHLRCDFTWRLYDQELVQLFRSDFESYSFSNLGPVFSEHSTEGYEIRYEEELSNEKSQVLDTFIVIPFESTGQELETLEIGIGKNKFPLPNLGAHFYNHVLDGARFQFFKDVEFQQVQYFNDVLSRPSRLVLLPDVFYLNEWKFTPQEIKLQARDYLLTRVLSTNVATIVTSFLEFYS